MRKSIQMVFVVASIFLFACNSKTESGKDKSEAVESNEMAMSGCDMSCTRSCCTHPDKETGGCLCAKKGKDCDAHCCAGHGEGGGHGGGDEHAHDSAHSHHAH